MSSIVAGQAVDARDRTTTLGLVTFTPDELDDFVERLDREWVAARGGVEELPPAIVDAVARAMLPNRQEERTRRTMPRPDASAVS